MTQTFQAKDFLQVTQPLTKTQVLHVKSILTGIRGTRRRYTRHRKYNFEYAALWYLQQRSSCFVLRAAGFQTSRRVTQSPRDDENNAFRHGSGLKDHTYLLSVCLLRSRLGTRTVRLKVHRVSKTPPSLLINKRENQLRFTQTAICLDSLRTLSGAFCCIFLSLVVIICMNKRLINK